MKWVGSRVLSDVIALVLVLALVLALALVLVLALAFVKSSVVTRRESERRFVALFKKPCIFPLVTGPNLGSLFIFCFSALHLRVIAAASSFVANPKKSNNSFNE